MSKRYQEAAKQIDRTVLYSLGDALNLLQTLPKAAFDETVELSASLNIDAKKTDQVVRGTVRLPHGTGKTRKVVVFCQGEQEAQAKSAGADEVGGAELIEKIAGGWLDFDVVISSPEMMRSVSRLGKVLGPRGKMPNPKAGTVTPDVAKAVREVKQGKIEFKMDKLANIHLSIGKRSFDPQKLLENGRVVIGAVLRAKPSSTKGRLVKRLTVSATMSPGIPVSPEGLEDEKA